MTEAEARVMQEHVAYWNGLTDRGIVVIVGPVADPKGAWGLAILEVDDEAAARVLGTNDPAMNSGLNFKLEVYPMPRALLRK
jgi:uncharacterized protein